MKNALLIFIPILYHIIRYFGIRKNFEYALERTKSEFQNYKLVLLSIVDYAIIILGNNIVSNEFGSIVLRIILEICSGIISAFYYFYDKIVIKNFDGNYKITISNFDKNYNNFDGN